MSKLYWLQKIQNTESHSRRFKEIRDNHIPVDDYTIPWIVFLTNHPFKHAGLDKAFHKQKNVSGKIGVLSKWLIKVANRENVSNELIKFVIDSKNDIKEYNPMYERWKRDKEQEIKNTPREKFWDLIDMDRKITSLENKIERNETNLRKASLMLIREVI